MERKIAFQGVLSELANFQIFAGLSSSEIAEFCVGGETVTSAHRETLFNFGDEAQHFGIVLSGAYKLSRINAMGEDTIIHFSTPGDVIGALILSQPKPLYPVSSIAMGPSRFLRLSKEVYSTKWRNHPELIVRIQNLLSTRMTQFHSHKVMTKAPLATKVASLLVGILEKSELSDESLLPLPLTRKEIADSLGASVESVIRIMSEWSKAGIIETKNHQIRILKLDKIIEQMGGS